MNFTAVGLVKQILAVIGVTLFCYAATFYPQGTVFGSYVPVPLSPLLVQIFERHFWQFSFGFIAIVFLSRGHLWSYGINSQNLKISMQWLGWLYAAVIVSTIVLKVLKVEALPVEKDVLPIGAWDTVMANLIYWMSSPVANQILFFGFAQTFLMKRLGDEIKIAGVPLIIFASSILFALLGTNSSLQVGSFSVVTTFIVGFYSGIVYWKTGSLITPMLGHGFVFGFPLLVELVTANVIH